MLRHEVDQVIDGLNVFEEHLAPLYKEISDELNQGLGTTAVANSLEARQQADANRGLLTSFVDLLPVAASYGKPIEYDYLPEYNRQYRFKLGTPAEVRWLQKSVAWLTPMVIGAFKRVDVAKPFYILGHKVVGHKAELLLVDATQDKDKNEVNNVMAIRMRRGSAEQRQRHARALLGQPIQIDEMNQLYREGQEPAESLVVTARSPNTQHFYHKDLTTLMPISGLFSLYTSPAIKALHPYGARIKSNFSQGVYDSDLRDYHVFDRLNELAVSFGVAKEARELYGEFRELVPALPEDSGS